MPLVIPVFIPHEGCPHDCVFCNQRRISGVSESPVAGDDVAVIIRQWLDREGECSVRHVQVAFYGGSFTGLSRARQVELLGAVAPFIDQGQVDTIRLSTRPDYVDQENVSLLEQHHVSIVELGVQSMDDAVLMAAGRGHGTADVRQAMSFLKMSGMEIGIQLMVGLPGQSRKSVMKTVQQVIELGPDFVRIYPVLVVRNSGLASLYSKGKYQPVSLSLAVVLAAWMKKQFDRAAIRVVRMGLQAGPELEKSYIAGPWHPAFGELVRSRIMLQQTRKLLSQAPVSPAELIISPRDQSVFRGIRSANMHRLQALGLVDSFDLRLDPAQQRGAVRLGPC